MDFALNELRDYGYNLNDYNKNVQKHKDEDDFLFSENKAIDNPFDFSYEEYETEDDYVYEYSGYEEPEELDEYELQEKLIEEYRLCLKNDEEE